MSVVIDLVRDSTMRELVEVQKRNGRYLAALSTGAALEQSAPLLVPVMIDTYGAKEAFRRFVSAMAAQQGDSANLKLTTADNGSKTFTLHVGDSLSVIDNDLDGVVVEEISKNGVSLSNGQEKLKGEEFFPDQFAVSYQEGMIELALMRHF